mmetsp:Transcript_3504/g.5133  ORF Transcript_3504/g.5133 Transcript_3504/m.5133 type:complete len:207 (+) Transcript_3504:806-1426(+)
MICIRFSLVYHNSILHHGEYCHLDSFPFQGHELVPCAIVPYRYARHSRYMFRGHDIVLGATLPYTQNRRQIGMFLVLRVGHHGILLRILHHLARCTFPFLDVYLHRSLRCKLCHRANDMYQFRDVDHSDIGHRKSLHLKKLLVLGHASVLRTTLPHRFFRLRISLFPFRVAFHCEFDQCRHQHRRKGQPSLSHEHGVLIKSRVVLE